MTFGCWKGLAQDIPKDTIYLDFNFYKKNCKHLDLLDKLKWKKKEGIQFNFCGKAVFIFPKGNVPDTLCYKHLKDYPITKIENIDSLVQKWQNKTKPLLIKKYGIPYPNTVNKNNMFVTYIIEKFKDYFVLYRVYWRNQRP